MIPPPSANKPDPKHLSSTFYAIVDEDGHNNNPHSISNNDDVTRGAILHSISRTLPLPVGDGQQAILTTPASENFRHSVATGPRGIAYSDDTKSLYRADVDDPLDKRFPEDPYGGSPQLSPSGLRGGVMDEGTPFRSWTDSAFDQETVNVHIAEADEIRASYAAHSKRRPRTYLFFCGALLLAGMLVLIGLGLSQKRRVSSSVASEKAAQTQTGIGPSVSPAPPENYPLTTGGDGSNVTADDGTSFSYHNSFGGSWVDDPNDPFNNNAQAQSWIPPLNQSWDWNNNRIFGVNLGGWLVIEPFITPALFEKYSTARDEWTLSEAIMNDPNSGGLQKVIENHYATFITEEDFAQIAGAGLGWVRIPFPFWAIETRNDEPFLEGVAWTYFLKAIKWARKYGLRINLDLHALPGSQNGFNHSGRLGLVNWLYGTMGVANVQRSLEYIRVITEFISQPEYQSVVQIFGVVNEASTHTIGLDVMNSFYLETHDMIHNISGNGAGHGPYMSMHDGFQSLSAWANYMPGSDRLILDSHPYLCFVEIDPAPLSQQLTKPCQMWGALFNSSLAAFGITVAGEWSLSFNDCGLYLNGVDMGTRMEGTFPGSEGNAIGSCEPWLDWEKYTNETKQELSSFAQSTMDAFPHWFFWTWKIGNSTATGTVQSPQWSYQLGLQQGWLPADPRVSIGTCNAAGINKPFQGPLQPTQTGGLGAGTVAPTWTEQYGEWPPASLANVDADAMTLLPTYTPTGTVVTLPPPAYTLRNGSMTVGGDGWFNAADTAGAPVNISGCAYPDAWAQTDIPLPTTTCGGGAGARRRAPLPIRTPPV